MLGLQFGDLGIPQHFQGDDFTGLVQNLWQTFRDLDMGGIDCCVLLFVLYLAGLLNLHSVCVDAPSATNVAVLRMYCLLPQGAPDGHRGDSAPGVGCFDIHSRKERRVSQRLGGSAFCGLQKAKIGHRSFDLSST